MRTLSISLSLILFLGGIYYIKKHQNPLKETSSHLELTLQETLQKVGQEWKPTALEKNASPDFKTLLKNQQKEVAKILTTHGQTLGSLKKNSPPLLKSRITKDKILIVNAENRATFQKGEATIKTIWSLDTSKTPLKNQGWALHAFIVTPKNPATPTPKRN